MKKLFIFLYFFTTFLLEAQPLPHLILHFDINKTLIASDKTENKSMEDVINELLSKKYVAYWEENLPEPLTFEAYVRTILLPGDEHDIKLKEARLVYLIHFIDYLSQHQHPLYQTVLEELTEVVETLKRMEGKVFSSFYRLLEELNQKKISYTLFLRSFGEEIFEVKNEINAVFKDLVKAEGRFRRGILYFHHQHLREPQAIYDFFCSQEHAAIHDDWHYWVEGKMEAKYGKPLYIDRKNRDILVLFFDDNIKTSSFEKNIISPMDCQTGQEISIPLLLQSKQLIAVNTLEAILNELYYIECVQEALRIHQMQ